MPVEQAYSEIAQALSEAAACLSHDNIRATLSQAVSAKHPDSYAHVMDVYGDENSGHVVYQHAGMTKRAKYSISTDGGKRGVSLGDGKKVMPRLSYDPLQESKESDTKPTDGVSLIESAVAFPTDYVFAEASQARPLLKIIDAGRGSSGHYSKEVLMRDGPNAFPKGTPMFINHQTAKEAAERPERDWNQLLGVTTGAAYWDENGKQGPALYAPAAILSSYESAAREKAPFTGMSIVASGSRDDKAIAPDGKPGVITSLERGQSIDAVVRAGRGGKLLMEAADALSQPLQEKESDMDAAELKKLTESVTALQEAQKTVLADNRKLRERQAVALDAPGVIDKYFTGIKCREGIRERVTKRVLEGSIPFTESGELDATKFSALVETEAKDEIAYIEKLVGGGRVIQMGSHGTGAADTAELTEESFQKEMVASFIREGMTEAQAKAAAGIGKVA